MSEVALLWAVFFMSMAGFYRKNDSAFDVIFAYASYFMAVIWVTIYFVFEILPQI